MWKPEYNGGGQRSRTLIRVLRLLRLLEQSDFEWPIADLADRFGVGPKTMRRDLRALIIADEK
jgi:predicted DNA-binding transcriptional regulator YafY